MFVSDHWHSELSLQHLGHRLRSVPMLVVLIPFVAGISLEECVACPMVVLLVVAVLMALLAWRTIGRAISYLYVAVALLVVGMAVARLGERGSTIPYDRTIEMEIVVESMPAPRGDYLLADGRVVGWCDDEWRAADERVQLWIRAKGVAWGSRLTVVGSLRERMSRYEGYNTQLRRRGYVGGVSITDISLLDIVPEAQRGLQRRAVESLGRYVGEPRADAVVVAMVAGSRAGLPDDLRDAYSRSGLAHLMAVSGLHLGIVVMAIGTLLLPLILLPSGHLLRDVLVIVGLWLFALASGASPSVLRAAVMVTVLYTSYALSSHYNSLNALSATVFVMLLYRANYLYDISFQLSVLAVMGIILWGVPICSRLLHRGVVERWVLSTIVVGVVATLWTLPLISSTFGRVPLVGVVLTPVAMVSSYLIIGCGLLAMVMPAPLHIPFKAVAEWAAEWQNMVVEGACAIPYGSVEYTISEGGVAIYYGVLLIITLTAWSIKRKKRVTLHDDDAL